RLESIRPGAQHEVIRPRAVYYDDKNEQFYVFADYLVPKGTEPSLRPSAFQSVLRDWQGLRSDGAAEWYRTGWDGRLVRTEPWSERYHKDSADYYDPHVSNFEHGTFRGPTIGELSEHDVWW